MGRRLAGHDAHVIGNYTSFSEFSVCGRPRRSAPHAGGPRPARRGRVQLGIVKGMIYSLDLFHAERHTGSSTFRIDTNLSFIDCGRVIPSRVK